MRQTVKDIAAGGIPIKEVDMAKVVILGAATGADRLEDSR
jgi:hypothetical protein